MRYTLMSLVYLKCQKCGGDISFDNDKKYGFCPFCGSKVIESQEIINNNNYITNNISAANITIENNDLEKMIVSADTFLLKHKDYNAALNIFKEISNSFPNDYRGWWGIVRATTLLFTNFLPDNNAFRILKRNYNYAMNVVPPSQANEISCSWEQYIANRKAYIEAQISEAEKGLADTNYAFNNEKNKMIRLSSQRSAVSIEINKLQQTVQQKQKEIDNLKHSINDKKSGSIGYALLYMLIASYSVSGVLLVGCVLSNDIYGMVLNRNLSNFFPVLVFKVPVISFVVLLILYFSYKILNATVFSPKKDKTAYKKIDDRNREISDINSRIGELYKSEEEYEMCCKQEQTLQNSITSLESKIAKLKSLDME